MNSVDKILENSRKLSQKVQLLQFSSPVAYVYNPLEYAWEIYCQYIQTYATHKKKIIFMGMNPGPFGMTQTGLPFGEINAVKNWIGIHGDVGKPKEEHPKRPVEGFACKRSEVSGRRLWGLFEQRFEKPEHFFKDHFVVNYCPLVFLEETGKNKTPDKLPKKEVEELYHACDIFLKELVEVLEPEWVVGIGGFAYDRALEVFGENSVKIGKILHPSPASPASNKDWPGKVTQQLEALGIWS